ncbi:alpha-amylase [Vibrio algarum]|uniref:Alpha-amylase n=1 Tax=Vibrio algarum TaxID=3020714 RepID=A0ABT4YUZ7_9VIBR|nr:alpha-amylase [Vibrio sp. KJ40-1]MDB1125397.1 alpha-amylase [Vibrio sp. KJ40-1]
MKLNTITTLLFLASANLSAATLTISTTTNSRDYPLSEEHPINVELSKDSYSIKITDIDGSCSSEATTALKFNTPTHLDCQKPSEFDLKIRVSGNYLFTFNQEAPSITLTKQKSKTVKKEFKRPIPKVTCDSYQGGEVTLNVATTFADGTNLREKFTGQVVTVDNQQVTLTPSTQSGGMVLLEPVKKQKNKEVQPLDWRNANIYFVMVDRFNNGNPNNDGSYGRQKDGKDEVGTFHGGDLKGVIEKLDYIQSLGTDALWLSPIVEQIHGFVGGGEKGSFPFYAYHGYWTRDFTKIDENFGNDSDLALLVQEAHKRGIKVLLDAVVNHSGYASLADLQFDGVDVVSAKSNWPDNWTTWTPSSNENWHSYNNSIDYSSQNWMDWWGPDWIRAGFPNHSKPGTGDIKMSLAGLPDFITESDKAVTPPKWLLANPGTRVSSRQNFTVSDYLIEWQTDWVKRFGIDGFRVDTVKHVEGEVWQRLKKQATENLNVWRKQNGKSGQPFWMMGEVWGHSAYRSPYFDDGFDALINFDMQKKMDKGAACFSYIADTYQSYADTIQSEKDFNPVSYMSSHDTELFFSRYKSFDMQRDAASALLLSPGAIQVYYGDEVARAIGPYADDFHQGTRSDMIWQLDGEREKLLEHWKILGQFRKAHPAIGAGYHKELKQSSGYAFSRILGDDKIIVAFVGK